MVVYIRSAAFIIVVTQKLVLQQSKNLYSILLNLLLRRMYGLKNRAGFNKINGFRREGMVY